MKTMSAKKNEIQPAWYLVDAEGQTLGRLASSIAYILRGKHKPIFTPHVDTGDYVVVINAAKVAVTGRKMDHKTYYHHTGYPGGMKEEKLAERMRKYPQRVITGAVRGMLPKTILGRSMLRKLKVYAGNEHPHAPQQPQILSIDHRRYAIAPQVEKQGEES